MVLLVIVVVMGALDLLRADSLLESFFGRLFGPRSYWPGFVDGLQRRWPTWR